VAGAAARATGGSWAVSSAVVDSATGAAAEDDEGEGDAFFVAGDGDASFFAWVAEPTDEPLVRRTDVVCFLPGWSLTSVAVAVWP
jgi:hypothetical protein